MPEDPLGSLFEEIVDEVEQLAVTMPAQQLAPLLEERAEALTPGTPGRAAWLCHAGERWEMAEELERARACYERAVEDGGGTFVDPRADLANILLDLGDTAHAEQLVDELWRKVSDGNVEEFLHERVGEVLELHGRYDEALRWFDAGLGRAPAGDAETLDLGCLNGHYRVRRALALPHDRHDKMCERRRRGYALELDLEKRFEDLSATADAAGIVVVYWPPAEFAQMLQRWPELAADCGADHGEHRTGVERRLRALSAQRGQRGPVAAAIGAFADYVRFAEARSHEAVDSSTRAMYGAHLAHLGKVVPWPPGRDARCWCGSGRTYKRCCGALRFPT